MYNTILKNISPANMYDSRKQTEEYKNIKTNIFTEAYNMTTTGYAKIQLTFLIEYDINLVTNAIRSVAPPTVVQIQI
jgi:hypothetical protein